MNGVVRNGRIETERPIDLPEGTELLISVRNGKSAADVEEGWDTSPEAIAAWIQWCDSLQPLKITAEEEADTDAWIRKTGEYEAAKGDDDIEGLFP
jgi:hypothetical protein